MGRIFSMSFENEILNENQEFEDLFQIEVPDGIALVLHQLVISHYSGDDLRKPFSIRRITEAESGTPVAPGSSGDAAVIVKHDPGGVDSALTDAIMWSETTLAVNDGTDELIHADSFFSLAGARMLYTPEMRPQFHSGQWLLVRMLWNESEDGPAISSTLTFEEFGTAL